MRGFISRLNLNFSVTGGFSQFESYFLINFANIAPQAEIFCVLFRNLDFICNFWGFRFGFRFGLGLGFGLGLSFGRR